MCGSPETTVAGPQKLEQWKSVQQGLENGEEKGVRLARRRLIINGVRAFSLRDPEPETDACVTRSNKLRLTTLATAI